VAEPIPLAELEFRILLLRPISRGAHLGGPAIHARRLVQLWRGGEMTPSEIGKASADELIARRTVGDSAEAKAIWAEMQARRADHDAGGRQVAGDRAILGARLRCGKCGGRPVITVQGEDSFLIRCVCGVEETSSRADLLALEKPETPRPSDRADHWGDNEVPLSQAFRLLGVEAVARAIFRTALMLDNDYPNDSVHWPLPPLKDLLPELNDAVWQAVLDRELQTEAVRYERGKTGLAARLVPLVELPRLEPDWELSRLCRNDRDEWLDVRVRRAPGDLPKREPKPKKSDLKIAMEEVAATHPPGARPPSEKTIWRALDDLAGPGVTRAQAREALEKYAPHLRGERGRPRKSSG
jgi:hypothetical protein